MIENTRKGKTKQQKIQKYTSLQHQKTPKAKGKPQPPKSIPLYTSCSHISLTPGFLHVCFLQEICSTLKTGGILPVFVTVVLWTWEQDVNRTFLKSLWEHRGLIQNLFVSHPVSHPIFPLRRHPTEEPHTSGMEELMCLLVQNASEERLHIL